MAVVVESERIGLPRGTTPSTHILKPTSAARLGRRNERLAYPGLVANEAFCMVLAGRAGLTTPTLDVVEIDGDPALLIERYDRATRAGAVVRLHQEDFCQALGVPSRLKYEKDGGPGLREHLRLLDQRSSDVLTDIPALIDRVAFNYLVGNADAHAKNFSLEHEPDSRLTPAYDVLSTYVYEHLTKNMATAINGMYDSRAIQPVHWRREIARLGLNTRLYAQRLADLADRVERALPEARGWVQQRSLSDPRLDRVVELIERRSVVLRAVREVTDREEGRSLS
jgi:serine/threonine-protein kinase HipA